MANFDGRAQTRFRCVVCGKLTAGRWPREGDGTVCYPRRHKYHGYDCPGNVREAEWVDVVQDQGGKGAGDGD